MSTTSFNEYALSLDEFALGLSLIGRPDLSRSILEQTFGSMGESIYQERLISASHSLLARDYCAISDSGTAVLSPEIEQVLFPILRFQGIIQFTDIREGIPVVTNIHIGIKNSFTAGRLQNGVVQKLWHGPVSEIAALIISWLPTYPELDARTGAIGKIIMKDLLVIQQASEKTALSILQKSGFSSLLLPSACGAFSNPNQRGSLISVLANDAQINHIDLDTSGPGFFYTSDSKSGWLIAFDDFEDHSQGIIYGMSPSNFQYQVEKLIKLIENHL